MKTTSFWTQLGYGLLLSVAGALLFRALLPLFGLGLSLRGLSLLLGLAYLVMIGGQSALRSGRLLLFAIWLGLIAALALFDPSLWLWFALPVLLGWLLRLPRYRRLSSIAFDAAISLAALLFAAAAALHSGSALLSLWTYFLLQALTSFIPAATPPERSPDDAFSTAERTAEAALRRLAQTTR